MTVAGQITDERLMEARAALDAFIALLDPEPPRGDHVEVAALSGNTCDEYVDKALSLTVGDFRALRKADAILSELQQGQVDHGLAKDVIDLVIEARVVAYEDQSPEAIRALDRAVEAFAERVGWDNDPEEEAATALTELQHRREAGVGAAAFIPQTDLDRLARTGMVDCRLYRERTGSRFVVPLHLAASPSSPGVRVKALEWMKHPATELWRADTMLGRYQVYAVISQISWAFDAYDGITRTSGDAASADEAKAAAQADYEARILSALGEHP